MGILNINDSIGLISCSNGLNPNMKDTIAKLISILNNININVIVSKALYTNKDGSTLDAEFRAKELMDLYTNKDVKAIFDLSGGDLCNELLDYLNYDDILKSKKPFIGYSDLTVIINSLYTKTDLTNFNYQLRNLVRESGDIQRKYFIDTFLREEDMINSLNYNFIKGENMEGIIVGGNIRCFLKLAGTEYIPPFEDKILFLEALSGDINKISTFIAQYKQIGAFSRIKGLILGNFTEMEKSYSDSDIKDYFLEKFKEYNFPIIKTSELGHNPNSKAIPIGKRIILK
ncbi:LD-carboxypeptidase [Clostridium sp. AL.422]|uniref:LD-carboxypeptidase n=1 Tax=Clostridium TaxID=1485 RepID=UPI00293DE9EB|nr:MULTISPECIES: LD-carboxypeptidase [unclassified Clostridium]MDV4152697.1 LD-carboxypeptidase [Clostridium sp. AL.422]